MTAYLPPRAQEYDVYKVVVRDGRDLITGKFEVAAPDRKEAQDAGERWAMDRGMSPGFNARVSVMRKIVDGEAATMLVAVPRT